MSVAYAIVSFQVILQLLCSKALNPTENKPTVFWGTENTRYSMKFYLIFKVEMFYILFNLVNIGVASRFSVFPSDQTGPAFC